MSLRQQAAPKIGRESGIPRAQSPRKCCFPHLLSRFTAARRTALCNGLLVTPYHPPLNSSPTGVENGAHIVGIRESLNKNPAITTGLLIGAVVLVIGFIFLRSYGGGPDAPLGASKAFFTIDDGKTYFADDASKIPPFQKDGKEAVRAHVYSCDGKPMVVYLQRFTPEAKKRLEAAANNKAGPSTMAPVQFTGIEVKAPGGKDWVGQNDEKAIAIMKPQCNGKLDVVSP